LIGSFGRNKVFDFDPGPELPACGWSAWIWDSDEFDEAVAVAGCCWRYFA
jgi:hypothetical protein